MTDIIKAIQAINPSAEVSVNAEDFEQITWLNGTAVISKADIQAKQAELQTEYDAKVSVELDTVNEVTGACKTPLSETNI